jgi:hypothetical protein
VLEPAQRLAPERSGVVRNRSFRGAVTPRQATVQGRNQVAKAGDDPLAFETKIECEVRYWHA